MMWTACSFESSFNGSSDWIETLVFVFGICCACLCFCPVFLRSCFIFCFICFCSVGVTVLDRFVLSFSWLFGFHTLFFSKQLVINSYMPPYYNIIGFSAAIHLNKFLKWYETGTRAVLNISIGTLLTRGFIFYVH